MRVDLVLRGGTICDGTGTAARTGDVVIHQGRILGTGRFDGPARRVEDVSGLIVAPGFVDVHTHYDAQVTWDPLCTPSCAHGITTVVLGNCGFGLAPCQPRTRDPLLRMLEHVEGMPYASLAAGVAWSWESFPEYLAALRTRSLGPNVAAFLGHSPVRLQVLGEEAYERPASATEIEKMCEIVRDAMAAGAAGLATSRSPGHVGEAGRPVPSRRADLEELRALVLAMASTGRGLLEITPETFPLSSDELEFLSQLSIDSTRPVCFSAVLDLPAAPNAWARVFEDLRTAAERGARVVPQVSCRPMRFEFDLETGCASLDALPCWKRFRAADSREARLALLADSAFRATMRAEATGRRDSPSSRRWREVVLEEAIRPENRTKLGRTLGEIALVDGGDEIDALLDLSRAEGFAARFSMVLLNFDEERVGELLGQPESLIALSDAGAHVSILCDAGYTSHLLGTWVRERGLFSWEEAVRRLTSMPSDVYGIANRGRLLPGFAADVVCFDPTRVAMCAPERVRDFPADATRYVVRAQGIERVLVAGEELVVRGEYTDERHGKVLTQYTDERHGKVLASGVLA